MIHTTMQLWFLAALLLVIFEMSAPGLFYSLSLACGAVVAAGAAYFEYSPLMQLWVFLLASIMWLWILKKWVVKNTDSHKVKKTNVYALVGKEVIIKKMTDTKVQVRLGDETWFVKEQKGSPLEIGATVIIKQVTGAQLIVEKINKK